MSLTLKTTEQYFVPDAKTAFLIRLLDLVGAVVGLIVLSPLLLGIGLLVKLTSPGPVFYRAERVGQFGRPFRLFKFRTMVANAAQLGPGITTKDDARITRLGHILRRTKLDELPQLLNVLCGQMSLVGPRPEDPRYVAMYTPTQRQVLAAKPGMTSAASFSYREEELLLAQEDWEDVYRTKVMPHKLALDLAYLQQRTVWSDITLILRTIGAILQLHVGILVVFKLRNRHFLLLDALALLLTPALALSLRLDGLAWWNQMAAALLFYTGVSLSIKLAIFHAFGLYRRYWRYASVNDLIQTMNAAGVATLVLAGLFVGLHQMLLQHGLAMPRSVPLIDGLLTGVAIISFRFGLRSLNHLYSQHQARFGCRRVLVLGAGEAGKMVVREMRANPQLSLEPVAFIDDDLSKVGTRIYGMPVAGTSQELEHLVARLRIEQIVLAVPSAPLGRQQTLARRCQETGLATYSLPGMYELLAGYKSISPVPSFDIHELLHREPVDTDRQDVRALLQGATVLVTGAGGSIGSELCRQIAKCRPKAIVLLGHGENSIFEITLDLRLAYPALVTQPVIVDVRNEAGLNQVVQRHRPDIIFHAAAHKHVPFMETHVHEAITNNILGTQNVLRSAERHGVERLVMISTDKAVNPTSIMGATKRMAELLVMATAQRSGRAYMAVRFGNVLGSRGSVLRIFQQQIAAGRPLTVTHPDMERYFMTIPEAVQLVLQASVLGQGSEAFVLDMGQPVRIQELAQDLIRLAGLEPGRDIDIVYSGIRPGEKLTEELFLAQEAYKRTHHPQIFVATQEGELHHRALEQIVGELIELSHRLRDQDSSRQIQTMLTKICYYIDKYQPRPAAESQSRAVRRGREATPPPDALQQPSTLSP